MGISLTASQYFSATYFEARDKFLAAAKARGLAIESHLNPTTKGPGGEALYADVVTLGRADAPHRLTMVSATHGVEGFCGSGCQTAFLASEQSQDLPEDLSITLLHAHNPHGFAWVRRVNEDNVDLNRNYVDFTKPLPENKEYDKLRDAIVLSALSDDSLKTANHAITKFGKAHGFDRVQEAITKGQYHDPQGLYHGGTKPTWSNKLFRSVVQDKIASASRAALIDFHTGLGPYGYGEIITEYELDDPAYKRAHDWYGGDITSTIGGDSSSAALVGTTDLAFHNELPGMEAVAIALEFGTESSDKVFAATRADNWLHLFGELDSDEGRAVKRQIRDAFYPDKDDWKEMILARAAEVISMTITGITK
jgi:hypothetical protein